MEQAGTAVEEVYAYIKVVTFVQDIKQTKRQINNGVHIFFN